MAAGNLNEAAGFFARALQANPHYTEAHSNLAYTLVQQQRWEPAAAEFRRVLADSPNDVEARLRLGAVSRLLGYQSAMKGNLQAAVAYWRESLQFRPDDAQMHNDLGRVLAQLGRIREAVPEFEAALRLNPGLEPARRNLQTARAQLAKGEH